MPRANIPQESSPLDLLIANPMALGGMLFKNPTLAREFARRMGVSAGDVLGSTVPGAIRRKPAQALGSLAERLSPSKNIDELAELVIGGRGEEALEGLAVPRAVLSQRASMQGLAEGKNILSRSKEKIMPALQEELLRILTAMSFGG